MIAAAAKPVLERQEVWSDDRLVRECLNGNQDAWSALIDKYKKLIYSIPVKWELPREEANDVFQAVCVDLYTELPRLREPKALPKWLIQTTLHKCAKHRRHEARFTGEEISEDATSSHPDTEVILEEVQQEQILRESILAVSGRCVEMIRMLFFETPARSYAEIAQELGLATGSIGFIRGRCLERLKKQLLSRGWK
jgi:RNA polymerase sigma factor (sigma-70 family)